MDDKEMMGVGKFVLVLVVGSHQGVYTNGDDKAVRFDSMDDCKKVVREELRRLKRSPIGKFELYCTPADGVVGDDE